MTADGMIWWSARTATVGLIVTDGVVTEAPPYARRWAQGRDARELWRRGVAQGVKLAWLPDNEESA